MKTGQRDIASQSELILCRTDSEERIVTSIEGSWFPDAFGGSMGDLAVLFSSEYFLPL
jgi:hypothetical protein